MVDLLNHAIEEYRSGAFRECKQTTQTSTATSSVSSTVSSSATSSSQTSSMGCAAILCRAASILTELLYPDTPCIPYGVRLLSVSSDSSSLEYSSFGRMHLAASSRRAAPRGAARERDREGAPEEAPRRPRGELGLRRGERSRLQLLL